MCEEDRRSSFPLVNSIAVEMVFRIWTLLLKISSLAGRTYLAAVELDTGEAVQVFRTDIHNSTSSLSCLDQPPETSPCCRSVVVIMEGIKYNPKTDLLLINSILGIFRLQ